MTVSILAKKSASILLFIGILFSINVVIQISNAPPALACSASSITPCINVATGWTGQPAGGGDKPPGSSGGGSGSGGGGGSARPVPIPCVGATGTLLAEGDFAAMGWKRITGCVAAYKQSHSFSYGESAYCAAKSENGFMIKSVGYINSVRQWAIFGRSDADGRVYYSYGGKLDVGLTCVYPKVSTVTKTLNCALNSKIYANRLAESRLGAGPKKITPGSMVYATTAGIEGGSDTCTTQTNMNFTIDIPSNEKSWGQYAMTGNINYAVCQQKTTTFEGKTTKVYKCGNSIATPAVTGYATLWCGGWKPSRVYGLTWTVNDCRESSSSQNEFVCTVPKPTFNGKTGTVQALRNGKNGTLNWGQPNPGKNTRNAKNWEYYLTKVKESTPTNTKVGVNSGSQFYKSSMPFSAWKAKASGNSQSLAFYTASNPNGSFKMTRQTRFDGQFLMKVTKLTGYDPFKGTIKATTTSKWVNDTNIYCNVGTSPSIQAVRAIGDVQ